MAAIGVDLARMRRERRERSVDAFGAQDADALLLLLHSNVSYATGASVVQIDAGRVASDRAVALLVAGDGYPHLFTPWPDGVPADYPADRIHPPIYPDGPSGALALVDFLYDVANPTRVLVDDVPNALEQAFARKPAPRVDDAAQVMSRTRSRKTLDEIGCIREAQRINELAMEPARAALHAGARAHELSAAFLAASFPAGSEACVVDPLWQRMPMSATDGAHTLSGGPAFPLPNDDRPFERGDVVWIDSGVAYAGYHSDFGRTWTVDDAPTPQQRDQFRRWRDVIDAVLEVARAGATGADLTAAAMRAAHDGTPWLPHLYLAHGIGLNSAETPLIGTDLGPAFDAATVLEPGNVFVLEPVIWVDGHAGYRAEEIVAITDTGCEQLSDYTYAPYSP